MFGSRKRIGYIAPTVIEVVAYEFYRFAPDGIGLTGVTCNIDDWRPDEFEKGLAQVAAAATYLGSRGVDFIIHGGGPLVVARGAGYEDMIVRDIEAAAKVKATTSVRAGMEALRHVGARRIAIASPYPKRHNDALTGYLTTQWLRGRPRRGHGSAVQGDAEPAARRHPGHSPAACWPPRRTATRSTCPARNGRRRRSSRQLEQDSGKLGGRLYARLLLRRVPGRWA